MRFALNRNRRVVWLGAFLFFWGCLPKPLPDRPGDVAWGLRVKWIGHSCFSLEDSVGRVVVMDPFDKSVGYAVRPLDADVVLITHNHFDHNHKSSVFPHKRSMDVVDSTGTVRVAGALYINGTPAAHDDVDGQINGSVILYSFYMGGFRVATLSDIGQERLSEWQLQMLGPIDVLFIPVGGRTTINGVQAKNYVDLLKPRYVFPMHYGKARFFTFDSLDKFTSLFPPAHLKVCDQSDIRIRIDDDIKAPEIVILTPAAQPD